MTVSKLVDCERDYRGTGNATVLPSLWEAPKNTRCEIIHFCGHNFISWSS